jgi:L-aminopeptidase/D-esterase-like protein
MSNGSGDYVITFSTAKEVRRHPLATGALRATLEAPNDQISPLFQAVIGFYVDVGPILDHLEITIGDRLV